MHIYIMFSVLYREIHWMMEEQTQNKHIKDMSCQQQQVVVHGKKGFTIKTQKQT